MPILRFLARQTAVKQMIAQVIAVRLHQLRIALQGIHHLVGVVAGLQQGVG